MKNLDQILGGNKPDMQGPKGKMSEEEIAAKLEVVQQLMQEMLASMGEGVKGHLDSLAKPEMQQVTVAAPNEELLEEGLEKAQEIVPEIADSQNETAPEQEDEEADDLFSMMQRKKKMMGKA